MTDPQLPPAPGSPSPVPPAPAGTVPPPAFAPPAVPAAAPAPAYPAPPGAYQVPVGGYAAPAGAYGVPEPTPRSPLVGVLALVSALVAAVVMPILVGVTGFEIGRRIPQGITATTRDALSLLSPARDQVLWAELSFWGGTVLGVAAIVLGIIAIRRKQGRGAGIGAVVVAVLAPVVFFLVLLFAFSAGSVTGVTGLAA